MKLLATTFALAAALTVGPATFARSLNEAPPAELLPAGHTLPKGTVGDTDKRYEVQFKALVDGKPWPRGVFGCDTTGLGRPDLPTFNDCAKLPPGLAFEAIYGCVNSDTGCLQLGGVPTKEGTYTFRIAASDGNGGLIVRAYTIVIEKGGLKFAPEKLPDAAEDEAYHAHITVTGGTPPYSVTHVFRRYMPGLTFDREHLTVSGTVHAATTRHYSLSLEVRDAKGETGRASYTFGVKAAAGGQLVVSVAGTHAGLGADEVVPLRADITVENTGTEATKETTLELTARSKDVDLVLEAPKGIECGKLTGSGSHAVHVSCSLPALGPGKDINLEWLGKTPRLKHQGGVEQWFATVTAHAGRGSPEDRLGDNTDSGTITMSVG